MKKTVVLIILIMFMSSFTILASAALIVLTDIKGSDKKAEESEFVEVYMYTPEKSVVANVKGGKKYVRFNYAVEVGLMRDFAELKKNEPMVTDLVLNVIRDMDEETFALYNAQDLLKDGIKEKLRRELGLESNINVYVTELVIQ